AEEREREGQRSRRRVVVAEVRNRIARRGRGGIVARAGCREAVSRRGRVERSELDRTAIEVERIPPRHHAVGIFEYDDVTEVARRRRGRRGGYRFAPRRDNAPVEVHLLAQPIAVRAADALIQAREGRRQTEAREEEKGRRAHRRRSFSLSHRL